MYTFIAALVILFISSVVHGQEQVAGLFTRHYGIEEGLPHSTVFRMLEDKHGFIWFGTKFGVARFDGKRFENFSEYTPLLTKQVLGITETDAGEILVYDYDGGAHIYRNGYFEAFQRCQYNESRVRSVLFAHNVGDKDIIHSYSNCWVFEKKGARLFRLNDLSEEEHSVIIEGMASHKDVQGNVYLATQIGVFRYTGDGFKREFASIIGSEPVYAITSNSEGTFWLGMKGSVLRIDRDRNTRRYEAPFLQSKQINVLELDHNGTLWFCGNGLGLCSIDGSGIKKLNPQIASKNYQINDIGIDRNNGIWLCTMNHGIYLVPYTHSHIYRQNEQLADKRIMAITHDPLNRIWVATPQDLFTISDSSLKRVRYKLNTAGATQATPPDGYITALAADSSGKVWLSVEGNHLIVFDTRSENIKVLDQRRLYFRMDSPGTVVDLNALGHYPRDVEFGQFTTRRFYTAPNGAMFATAELVLYTQNNFSFASYDSMPGLGRRQILGMYRQKSGAFWIASDSGIYRRSVEGFRHYTVKDGLQHNRVVGICSDANNNVWAATNTGVVCITADTLRSFTEHHGLSRNFCTSIVADHNGTIWIGTTNGLNAYHNGTFVHVTTRRGLASNEVQTLHVDRNNILWVGTIQGLSSLKPSELLQPRLHPGPVQITALRYGDTSIRGKRHLRLHYDRSNIRISYAPVHYAYPEGIQFQYMMTGVEDEWRTTDEWTREYQNLPSGEHEFRIRTRLDGGKWSETNEVLRLSVISPWWETWWFRIAVLVLLAALGYGLHRLRMNRVNRREAQKRRMLEVENKLVTMELRALNLSMSPHFLANALNSIQFFFNSDSDREHANNYLSTFGSLIRQVIGDTHNDHISLDEELDRLTLYLQLEQIRMGDKMSWSIDVAEHLDTDLMFLPVMLIQPFVENAIWHGISPLADKGHVQIKINSSDNDDLIVEVIDDGIGIANSQARKSKYSDYRPRQGMVFTRERLNLLNKAGRVNIQMTVSESRPDCEERPGTRVEIILSQLREYTATVSEDSDD